MIIYLTTNLINGKQYVGQSSINDNNYLGSGLLIQKAINKYNRKNFRKIVLVECSSQEELDEQEIFWIEALDTLQPNGYNISLGGNGHVFDKQIKELKRLRCLYIASLEKQEIVK